MLVFKFGGASVKDAAAVKNVAGILDLYKKEQVLIIVSAMDKTTNALERVVNAYIHRDNKLPEYIEAVKNFHTKVMDELGFPHDHPIRGEINNCFVEIDWVIEEGPSKGFAFAYDQIVSQGELMSTRILSAYLNKEGISNEWMDARDVLQTDNTYREATVEWELTSFLITKKVDTLWPRSNFIITQGFIGSTSENYTTTLGREGSDYSAAIFSHCLNAREMIVWKDVPGILSADPKYSNEAVKLDQLSYHDAIELTYYGATVIHPKTIKPLENKNIPLRVMSFKAPKEKGSIIGNFEQTKPLVPCFIFKTNQILISISAKDFSFIAEESLSQLFRIFADLHIKINLMQNSAISFSVCTDDDPFKIPELLELLKKDYHILYNNNLRLITIRHYYASTIDQLMKDKKVLLEQRSRQTAQLVIREN